MKQSLIQSFAGLFQGYEKAHGKHHLLGEDEDGKIKGKAQTFAHGATLDDFKAHLSGTGDSLGIIPLRDDNTCLWGAIDIDIRGPQKMRHTLEEIEKMVEDKALPLVVCRSKSGGAHLYLFCTEPVQATLLTTRLSNFSAVLGYGGCEIFPKQVKRVNEFDRGNWINLCYYDAAKTERYAIEGGLPLALEDFIEKAISRKVSARTLKELKVLTQGLFLDGPPCLQHLSITGFEEGGRNNAMINIGVYLRQKYPDTWQDELMKFNYEHIKPPLSNSEVSTVIKSLSRKEYNYTCSQPPICNHCDKKLCRKREFGVTALASDNENFPIESLTKFHSKGSYRWYAQCNGERVQLTTEELLQPSLLRRVFMERFNQVINTKNDAWYKRLKDLMESVDSVEDPEDASELGQMDVLIESFIHESAKAWDEAELLKGNLFIDGGQVHFRSKDLINYLKVYRIVIGVQELWHIIKSKGGTSTKRTIKGSAVKLWSLPASESMKDGYHEESMDKGAFEESM